MPVRALSAIVIFATLLCQAGRAREGRRMALVIGNQAYRVSPLGRPVSDAERIAAAVEKAGFRVTLRKNLEKKEMEKAAVDFVSSLDKGDIAFVYYSGHATEEAAINYLLPIDFQVSAIKESLAANHLVADIESRGVALQIVVLDACRSALTRGNLEARLVPMESRGALVAFATARGGIAFDDGYYAERLAVRLLEPGVPVLDVFRHVGEDLATAGKVQTPYIYSSIAGSFFFVQPTQVVSPLPRPAPEREETFIGRNQRLAAAGDAKAQEFLAGYYFVPGPSQDVAQARAWFEKAAKGGSANAAVFYGSMLLSGEGGGKDAKEAVRWFRQSATAGNPKGKYWLAYCLMSGDGIDVDKPSALRLLREASQAGYAPASDALAQMKEQ